MQKKVSILMPTYNDQDSIIESIKSVIVQSNSNWELIIINDGSIDSTEEVVKDFIKRQEKKRQIKYFYQENQDQLRALENGSKYITGDYVMFLHSDDLLYDQNVIDNILNHDFSDCDVILCDLPIIDKNSKLTGQVQKLNKINQASILEQTLLMLGRQQYLDTFISTKEYFLSEIINNYIKWNMPFYLSFDYQARIRKVSFYSIKYRVHQDNYINNRIGKLNVINGELRTALTLAQKINIPFFNLQFLLFRLFRKVGFDYKIYSRNQQFGDRSFLVNKILRSRFSDQEIEDNLYLKSLRSFHQSSNKREIELVIPKNEKMYLGSDVRIFNKDILDGQLSSFYKKLLAEMQKGFSIIKCPSKDVSKIKAAIKFLVIDGSVKVEALDA